MVWNKELSKKTGVNVYVLDGDPFLAFVKSFTTNKDNLLTNIKNSYVDYLQDDLLIVLIETETIEW